MIPKGNVTIYLPLDVLARCRAAAEADQRSLSNYLCMVLERAHPASSPTGAKLDAIVEKIHSIDKKQARKTAKRKGDLKSK